MDLESDWGQQASQLTQEDSYQCAAASNCIANSVDICMDMHLNQQLSYASIAQQQASHPSHTEKRKRGRKPLRPNDPIKKKTEEKDKYWLRAFRSYMKLAYKDIEGILCPREREFWAEFFTLAGKPSKGRK